MAMSLTGMIHHLLGFWLQRDRDDIVLLHYDDLQTDLEGEMRRLAGRLGIDVPGARWPVLVKAATFDDMRRRAEERAPDTANSIWKSTTDFFHKRTSGQWEGVLDAAPAPPAPGPAPLPAPAPFVGGARGGRCRRRRGGVGGPRAGAPRPPRAGAP